jgi:tRNA (guanine37-N1)-methyltransferase
MNALRVLKVTHMRIDIITLFPEMFRGPFDESIIKRAVDSNLIKICIHNLRDYARDKHGTVDDYPYGGGAGMVLKPEPIFDAVEAVRAIVSSEEGISGEKVPVILLTPQGRLFIQSTARDLSKHSYIILLCGHYEGVDERVVEHLVNDEISIGDYVLSGGELAAMVVVDAVVRLIPGVLGSEDSAKDDSHVAGLLEYPQYTRPSAWGDWEVPEVLLSGDHAKIAKWRRQQAIGRTLKRRPDLLNKAELDEKERVLVEEARHSSLLSA